MDIFFKIFSNLLNSPLFEEKDRTGWPVRSLSSEILQRKLLVDVLGAVERTLLKQRLDLAVRVDQRADRHIVVQGGNEIRDILRNIDLVEPRAVAQLRVQIGQVAAEDAVDQALLVRLVELLEAVREDGVRRIGEEAVRAAILDVLRDVEHGIARGNDVVRDENVLALDGRAEILVRDDRVAAVHDAGIIAALVEHAELHAKHGGIIHVAVQRALIRADDHEIILVGREVREILEELFQHLICRHQVVKAHDRHGVLHARVVRVKGEQIRNAHLLQLLQHVCAVERLAVAAAVLAAAVQQRHDDVHAVRFAARRLNQAL